MLVRLNCVKIESSGQQSTENGSFLLLVAERHLQGVVASLVLLKTADIHRLLVHDRY